MMTQPNERGVTLGQGPFQPPTMETVSELQALLQARDIEMARQEERIARLTSRINDLNATLRVESTGDLSGLLQRAFGGREVFVDVDADGELEVRIPSLTIQDDEIVPAEREFEVSTEIVFRVSATVIAGDDVEARERFAEALDSGMYDVTIDLDGDGISDSYCDNAEHGLFDVNEA